MFAPESESAYETCSGGAAAEVSRAAAAALAARSAGGRSNVALNLRDNYTGLALRNLAPKSCAIGNAVQEITESTDLEAETG